jgi:ubiquinone/menaquinone biosynthesis C-methylase UbiE
MSNNSPVTKDRFWKIRSDHFDNLFWTRDEGYLETIIKIAELEKHHIALDVGTGTGTVAKELKEKVNHVVAVDISQDMLKKGRWEGISIIKWDIGDSLFKDHLFHRVIARMVFHHILNNIDRAILRCFDLLKDNGKIIIAEGVPPSSDPNIVSWYTEMFKLKENRRTFLPSYLVELLNKNGFKNVELHEYYMKNFSIINWLENSGLDKRVQEKLVKIHVESPDNVKEAYKMRITSDDCIIRAKNVIVTGEKQ